MPAHHPNVALLVETSNAYARGLLRGIRAYVREHGPWSIYLGEQRRGEAAPSWLRGWKGDGIIARIENPAIARAITASHIPAVDLSAGRHLPSVPYVETDDEEIARLAVGHLLERGFRNLAFCGDDQFHWSGLRRDAFIRRLVADGYAYHVYAPRRGRQAARSWEDEKRQLATWLKKLPKPVGVMAAYDIRGRQVLDVCRELSIAVPDEVAVIGVDNDELLCDLAAPPLSSVVPDKHRTGYEAAALLDRMLHGERVPPGATLIKPLGIKTRGSTDVLAIDDADVSAAVRFIRHHATDGIKVEDVIRAVPLSRRVLESRFKKLIGRTPHDEIVRVQIERVKQLLIETDLSLAAIADRAGYKHIEYMTVAFKRETGQPPSAYRAEHRE
jgi:LacI family transcriptional regulator